LPAGVEIEIPTYPKGYSVTGRTTTHQQREQNNNLEYHLNRTEVGSFAVEAREGILLTAVAVPLARA
jgi:hypothetical protein